MADIEIVDREYDRVDEAESDVRKKPTTKVKLTEASRKVIDFVYASARRKEKKLEAIDEKINEKEKDVKENYDEMGMLSSMISMIEIENLRKKKHKLSSKISRANRRAVRIEKWLKKTIIFRFLNMLNKLDVNKVDRESISNNIDKEFKSFSNSNKEENKMENQSDINVPRDRFANETDKEYTDYLRSHYSPETSIDLSEGTYSFKKDQIIQDDLSIPTVTSTPTVIPEFQQFFDSIPRVEKAKEDTDSELQRMKEIPSVDEDIVSKANEGLNNPNVTADYLTSLREKLEAARARKTVLTDEVAKKETTLTTAEKEAAAAEKEKNEKIRLVQNELKAYDEENKKLEEQKQQLEEKTQRQISMRQQSLDTISVLNEMMGDRAVNVSIQQGMSKGGK